MAIRSEEELRKSLVSGSFKEEDYSDLSIAEMIILKNSSANVVKAAPSEEAVQFFKAKEDFMQFLITKNLPKLPYICCLFSKNTRVPFVTCDEESMNDQVWIYSEENYTGVAMKHIEETRNDLMFVKVENKDFLPFFTNLFTMGINELVVDKYLNSVAFDLSKLIKAPDYSKLPEKQRPVMNPELFLTAIYFTQEMVLPDEKKDKQKLVELEEEMLANISRGKLLVPVIFPEGAEKPEMKDMQLPLFKLPNGDAYQVFCTDPTEFSRFNKEKKMRTIVVDGANVAKLLPSEVKGIMLNPDSLKVAIPKQKL